MRQVEVVLCATFDEVARATERLRAQLPDWLAGDQRDAVELALAEALTNIVEHGYAGGSMEEIRVHLFDRPGALEVDVWDRGLAIPEGRIDQADDTIFDFDPTDLGALPEGGMGLALIKAAFDEVDYASHDGLNRLHLVHRLH
jgi:serine/threonine-protein kinase RsbW